MTIVFVIGFFLLGVIMGRMFRGKLIVKNLSERLMMWAIYLLLFLLGISVGINPEIMNNLPVIGLQAFLLALGALLGSVVMAKVLSRYFNWKSIKRTE